MPPSSAQFLGLFPPFFLLFFKISSSSNCFDQSPGFGLPSDCPNRHQLCVHPLYSQLMAAQCPLTCGLCAFSPSRISNKMECADQFGPFGISDCPKFPERCRHPLWMGLMRQFCPQTCGFCPPQSALFPLIPQAKQIFFDFPDLANSVNPRLRPCDDFHAFVCDGFKKENSAMLRQNGGQMEAIGHFNGLGQKAEQRIIGWKMGAEYSAANLNPEILSGPQFRRQFRQNPLFANAFAFFDSCVDLAARNAQKGRIMGILFGELRRIRAAMGPQGYSMNTQWLRAVFPLFPVETKVPRFGPQPPFLLPFLMFRPIPLSSPKTGQFARDGNVFLYELAILDPTPPPIPPEEQYRIIGGIMAIVMADDLEMNGNSPLLAPRDQMALQGAVKSWVDEFRSMDEELRRIFVKFNSIGAGQYQIYTLRQIQQQFTPSIDWAIFLGGVDPRMNAETKVMLKCGECFADLEALLAMGGQNPTKLRNYLETHIVLKYKFAFDGRFRELAWGRQIPDTPQRMSIESICMARTATHFEKQLDRLYIDTSFEPEGQRMVGEMIRQIQAEFGRMLEEADWMGESTRQRALLKFQRMGALVGYFEQIRDDRRLDRENRCYKIDGELMAFGEMELEAAKCTIGKIVETNVLVDENGQMLFYLDEYIRSYEPNGAYQPNRNVFIVLAAILQIPFFHKGMPEAVRFGGVGILIAHEITHGFDNRGRRFNEEGREENWWDPETEQKFIQKSQCFVRQYGNYKISFGDKSEMAVNGELTLSENIPDNGGMKAAFRTLRRNLKKQGRQRTRTFVRRMEQFNDEQLFFINFAFTFCSVESDQFLRRWMKTDIHSPNQARVNLVTGNSRGFYEAFGCKEGDKMYIPPLERCELW